MTLCLGLMPILDMIFLKQSLGMQPNFFTQEFQSIESSVTKSYKEIFGKSTTRTEPNIAYDKIKLLNTLMMLLSTYLHSPPGNVRKKP